MVTEVDHRFESISIKNQICQNRNRDCSNSYKIIIQPRFLVKNTKVIEKDYNVRKIKIKHISIENYEQSLPLVSHL